MDSQIALLEPIPYIPSLDSEAEQIIRQRWPALLQLHQHCLPYMPLNGIATLDLPALGRLFALDKPGASRAAWWDKVLVPFADSLGLRLLVEQTLLKSWLKRGLCDMPDERGQLHRPTEQELGPRLWTLLYAHPHRGSQVAALVEQQLCRDTWCATQVNYAFQQMRHDLAGLGRSVVLACGSYGSLGLLVASPYPYLDVVLLLQRQAHYVGQLIADVDTTLATLRADLIALQQATSNVKHTLWRVHLLHEPPGSSERVRYEQVLTTERVRQVIERIAEHRACSTDEATTLFRLYRTAGLPAIIDWRCGVASTFQESSFLHQRIQYALDRSCAALLPWGRHKVELLLHLLLQAIHETGAPFSLLPLLRGLPSTAYRRRRGRAIWFGAGAIQQRRQRGKKKQQLVRVSTRSRGTRKLAGAKDWPDVLIARFAVLAGIEEPDARSRVRDLITYGPVAVLAKGERLKAIDSRYLAYLELLKFGHLDGTIRRARLRDLVNRYGELYNLPPLSLELLLALFNMLPRPRRWHGGEGLDVGGVAQRAAPVQQRPQLHRSWLIVAVRLDLQLTGSKAAHCWALVVIEEATQLPMGGWLSEGTPGPVEIGLALYDAIWHPSQLVWPRNGSHEPFRTQRPFVWGIRGIP